MNYPNGIKKNNFFSSITYGNRGMNLESDINITNKYYQEIGKAFIYKKPTPIKIVNVDYQSRKSARITEAYFMEPSTTDYNGIYNGKYYDFEAKETKNKTSFSINNIHIHQIDHLRNVLKQGAIAFLIVRFTTLDLTFLLMAEDFFCFYDNTERKSIPLEYFKEKGYLIKTKINPRLDYLEIIDNIYGGI